MDAEAIEYLNQNFSTIASLDTIEQSIREFDQEILCVE
jgi:hypothetical protein